MSGSEYSILIELINECALKIKKGQTLLDASLEAGIPHHHACGGNAKCSTCRVLVEEGAERLSPPSEEEAALARSLCFGPNVRLACQARVTAGPVRFHRLIRDRMDQELFVSPGGADASRSLGEERELALFFLDIRNFTAFAGSLLPFDVIHILNRFSRMIHGVIRAHGGRVIDVAGDGLFSAFGMEGTLPEAVGAAVRAAGRIHEEIHVFNDEFLQVYFGHRFEVGMGLHAGPVICGDIGVVGDGSLAVLGHHVNVAARLEQATKELNNNFLVSECAFGLLPDPPAEVPSAELELKGVSGRCSVYLMGRPFEGPASRPAV